MPEIKNLNKVMDIINREYAKIISPARYKYYQDEKKNRYFYTTEKINHNDNPRYAAGIYRYYKTKKQWKLAKKVGFAKKKRAIDWAYNQYQRSAKKLTK